MNRAALFRYDASPATALQRDEVVMLLADALLPDWAGMERLLDRFEVRFEDRIEDRFENGAARR